jgi:hypothetical protein
MSLKTDFFDGSTGLLTQCDDAFAAGQAFVTTNLTGISTDLKTNAASGFTNFTLNYPATLGATLLRGANGHNAASKCPPHNGHNGGTGGRHSQPNNQILKAYLAGIQDGMALQNIYNYECAPQLNVTDSIDTTIDLVFTF